MQRVHAFPYRPLLLCLISGVLFAEACFLVAALGMSPKSTWLYRLPSLDFPVLGLLLGIIMVLLVQAFRDSSIRTFFSGNRTHSVLLLGIVCIGVFLRLSVPLRHWVFYDEELYIHSAQMLLSHNTVAECGYGTFDTGKFTCHHFSLFPGGLHVESGYPVLLALFFALFGHHTELLAYVFAIILGISTIILAYFIGKLLLNEKAGLAAAALFTFFPEHLWWSVTPIVEIPALLFLLLSLLFLGLYHRYGQTQVWMLSLALLLYGAFTRPEILFLVPLFFLVRGVRLIEKPVISKTEILQTVLLLGFILANVFANASNWQAFFASELHLGVTTFFSMQYFFTNIVHLGTHFLQPREAWYIVPLVLFACVGAYAAFQKNQLIAALLLGAIAVLFTVNASYLYTSYPSFTVLSPRYVFLPLMLLTLLGGAGIAVLPNRFFAPLLSFACIAGIIFSGRLISLIPFSHSAHLIIAREKRLVFQEANPSCFYVDEVSNRSLFHNYSAAHYSTFMEQRLSADQWQQRFPCVVWFETHRCSEELQPLCQQIKSSYRWKKIPYSDQLVWLMETPGTAETVRIPQHTVVYPPPSFLRYISQIFL